MWPTVTPGAEARPARPHQSARRGVAGTLDAYGEEAAVPIVVAEPTTPLGYDHRHDGTTALGRMMPGRASLPGANR